MTRRSASAPLRHIIEAISDVQRVTAGKQLPDIEGDRDNRALLERYLEIVSEASRRLPDGLKARHPEIPWRDIAGLGNVIRHDYDGVEPKLLLEIVRNDIPILDQVCKAALEHESQPTRELLPPWEDDVILP